MSYRGGEAGAGWAEAALSHEDFRRDVLEGLSQSPKALPCKYLYDEHGAYLFETICDLDEYYPTRTELAILQQNLGEKSGATTDIRHNMRWTEAARLLERLYHFRRVVRAVLDVVFGSIGETRDGVSRQLGHGCILS